MTRQILERILDGDATDETKIRAAKVLVEIEKHERALGERWFFVALALGTGVVAVLVNLFVG